MKAMKIYLQNSSHYFRWSLLLILCTLCLWSCGKKFSGPQYSIAIDYSWFPLDLNGREKQLLGFSKDLLQEIAELKNMQIAVIKENWDTLMSNLQKEKYDAIFSSMQP